MSVLKSKQEKYASKTKVDHRDSGNDFDHFSFPFLEVGSQITKLSCYYPIRKKKLKLVLRYLTEVIFVSGLSFHVAFKTIPNPVSPPPLFKWPNCMVNVSTEIDNAQVQK